MGRLKRDASRLDTEKKAVRMQGSFSDRMVRALAMIMFGAFFSFPLSYFVTGAIAEEVSCPCFTAEEVAGCTVTYDTSDRPPELLFRMFCGRFGAWVRLTTGSNDTSGCTSGNNLTYDARTHHEPYVVACRS